MSTCKALMLETPGTRLQLQTIPTPQAIPGSVVVQNLTTIVEGFEDLISGTIRGLKLPTPFVPGGRSISRVAAIGIDTTSLEVGQLVLVEPFIRARDELKTAFLFGLGVFGDAPKAVALQENAWRNGTSAEYTRVPLENCYPLNEKILLGDVSRGGLGYTLEDLALLGKYPVSYGGFRGINLKAGERVIVAPATGAYSMAAVEIASALGANVIAVGRNLEKLQEVAAVNPRVNIVQLKGDVKEDLVNLKKFGPIEAYLDLSPAVSEGSTHVRSCLLALEPYGRASLMGIITNDIPIPYVVASLNNLTIRGQYMYEREHVRDTIKLVESGVLKLGKEAGYSVAGRFSLSEGDEAVALAAKLADPRKVVVLSPSSA